MVHRRELDATGEEKKKGKIEKEKKKGKVRDSFDKRALTRGKRRTRDSVAETRGHFYFG